MPITLRENLTKKEFIMRYLFLLLFIVSCATPPVPKSPTPEPISTAKPTPVLKLGKKRQLWSTFYKTPELKSHSANYFCLRNKDGKCISGRIKHDQKCFIQMQGSGVVDGDMFAYHSASSKGIPSHDSCATYGNVWKGSGNVKFYINNNFKYGKGSFNNPLVPYVSIACPREFKNNHKFFIPDAKGVTLPDGSIHDGIFICHDRGGAIKGNHIDTFLGLIDYSTNWKMFDWNRGAKSNPFNHIHSTSSKTFVAYDVVE